MTLGDASESHPLHKWIDTTNCKLSQGNSTPLSGDLSELGLVKGDGLDVERCDL